MKATRTDHTDGSVTLSVKRMEKIIRARDGSMRKLYSFDGERWRMDAKAEKRRMQSAENLHGAKWRKAQEKKFVIANNKGSGEPLPPVILPVEHRTSPLLGKEKGKNQKYHKALKPRKPEREVLVMRPVHRHRCHGRYFLCSCEFSYFKRLCGGTICLHQLLKECENHERAANTRNERHERVGRMETDDKPVHQPKN
jgi:hypothetical protein